MVPATQLRLCAGCHCLAARRAARAITRVYDERLRPHGLRVTQFSVLAALALGGPSTAARLAESLGLERTTLLRSAALLARRGWIREGPPRDRRERPIQLTPTGRAKLLSAFPAWKRAQDSVDAARGTPGPRQPGPPRADALRPAGRRSPRPRESS